MSKSKNGQGGAKGLAYALPATDPMWREEGYDDYHFKHVATWETQLYLGGLAYLSPLMPENAKFYHEAFIALGKDPKGNGGDIIFIAEFGDGDVIPRYDRSRRALHLQPQEFTGYVAFSVKDAVTKMSSSEDLTTWVRIGAPERFWYSYVYHELDRVPNPWVFKDAEDKNKENLQFGRT